MTASGRDAVRVERDDLGVATISINRPERMNALDHATVTALTELITEHGGDPATRVIVLAGEGGAFTTGADLQAIGESGGDAPSPDVTMDNAAALVAGKPSKKLSAGALSQNPKGCVSKAHPNSPTPLSRTPTAK